MRGDRNFKGSDSSDPSVYFLFCGLKVFFEEKQYFFADLPPNSAFPNLTLDARSSVIYNLYGCKYL